MQSQVGLRKHHYEQASGGGGIPVELFQILIDDAVKVLHSICQHFWKVLAYRLHIWKTAHIECWHIECTFGKLHILSAHLENSAVATGLENVSFHSNPKERQCQRMSEVSQKEKHQYSILTHIYGI